MRVSELARAREEFWDTRTEGAKHVWQAIRLSLRVDNIPTSIAICEGAGLSPFVYDKSTHSCHCFDELGTR